MIENEVKTITIPIDEYIDLREKAKMNMYLMERLGRMDGELCDLNCRLIALERMKESGTHNG
jgi:hypothetical protein